MAESITVVKLAAARHADLLGCCEFGEQLRVVNDFVIAAQRAVLFAEGMQAVRASGDDAPRLVAPSFSSSVI